jgi:DNA-binding transcriptional regulator YhcF (GntR family)
MLPPVPRLASDDQINPLTVAKAYKELSRDGLTDELRGEGLGGAQGGARCAAAARKSQVPRGEVTPTARQARAPGSLSRRWGETFDGT